MRRACAGCCATALGSLTVAAEAGAATSLDELFVSPAAPVQLDVGDTLLNVQDRPWSLQRERAARRWISGRSPPASGIEAFHVDAAGARYFAVDVAHPARRALRGPDTRRRALERDELHEAFRRHGPRRSGGSCSIDAFGMDSAARTCCPSTALHDRRSDDRARGPRPMAYGSPVLRFDASAPRVYRRAESGRRSPALERPPAALLRTAPARCPVLASFRASDALEFDPATWIWQHNVVGSDFDPDWTYGQPRRVACGLRARARRRTRSAIVRALADRPGCSAAQPTSCASIAARIASRGSAPGSCCSPNVAASAVSIGGCSVGGCNGAAASVRPSTATRSSSTSPRAPGVSAAMRSTCDLPGARLLRAGVHARTGRPARRRRDPRGLRGRCPVPAPTSEGAAPTLREAGATARAERPRLRVGALDPDYEVRVRRALGDYHGLSFEVLIRGRIRLHQLGLALLPPAGVGTGLSFAGCIIARGTRTTRAPARARRRSDRTSTPRLSSTIGPAASGLAAARRSPERASICGSPAPPGSSARTRRSTCRDPSRAGPCWACSYAPSGPVAARTPPVVLVAGLGPGDGGLAPTLDEFLQRSIPIGGPSGSGTPGGGDPTATTTIPGRWSRRVSAEARTTGTMAASGPESPPDGIGDDCQCGDVAAPGEGDPDGIIEQDADVEQIRAALTGGADTRSRRGSQVQRRGGDRRLRSSSAGLRKDCNIADVAVLTRLLEGELVDAASKVPPPDRSLRVPARRSCGVPEVCGSVRLGSRSRV